MGTTKEITNGHVAQQNVRSTEVVALNVLCAADW
jgi:hypothetical protein